MKRWIALILCAILLAGCAAPATYAPHTESADPAQRLADRRDRAESYMRHMMSLRWKVPNAVTYSSNNSSKGVKADADENEDQIVNILASQVYEGIPYTHGGGSGYSFLALAGEPDENGIYTLEGLTQEMLNGYSGNSPYNTSRLGNDCADAVFWAWAQVSATIRFPYSNCMVPAYGCIRVGDYACSNKNYAGNTSEICKQNGEQRMFEAYACLEKADALVRTINSSGHAIMAVSIHVVRTEEGIIDPNNSYIVYLDQDVACEAKGIQYEDPKLGTVMKCEILDKRHTFSDLYRIGYLPVTCKELIDPTPLPEAAVHCDTVAITEDGQISGIVEANYRIAYVQMEIRNKSGNLLQKAICFGLQEDMYRLNLRRITDETEQPVILGGIHFDELPAGSYQCIFSCRLSNGDMISFGDVEYRK